MATGEAACNQIKHATSGVTQWLICIVGKEGSRFEREDGEGDVFGSATSVVMRNVTFLYIPRIPLSSSCYVEYPRTICGCKSSHDC